MLDYTDRTFRYKVVFLGLLIPIFLGSVFLLFFYRHSFDKMVDSGVARARAVCDAAESLSNSQSPKFAVESSDLKEGGDQDFNKEFPAEPSLEVIPDLCQKKLDVETDEYRLSVIRLPSTETDSLSDEFQNYGIEMIKTDGFEEYYDIDSSDTLRYLRPIKASKRCLGCHGNLGKSSRLWVDTHGQLDKRNLGMTGWKDGQICGAFEVVESLADEKKELAGVVSSAGIILITGLTIYAVLFMVLVMWIINWFDVPDGNNDESEESAGEGEIIEDGEMEEHESEEQEKMRC